MAQLRPTLEQRVAELESQVAALISRFPATETEEDQAIAPTEKMSDEQAIEALFGAANAAGAVEQGQIPDGLIVRNAQG